MSDLTLTGMDQTLMSLLLERASETGQAPEELAKDALLRGMMWSSADRLAHADRIRATGRPPVPGRPSEDSTLILRRLRDGA